jgi:hypothetical protein
MTTDLLRDLPVEHEDWEGAEAAYQAVIDTADPYWAPTAQTDLAKLCQQRGNVGRARELPAPPAQPARPKPRDRIAEFVAVLVIVLVTGWARHPDSYRESAWLRRPGLPPHHMLSLGRGCLAPPQRASGAS